MERRENYKEGFSIPSDDSIGPWSAGDEEGGEGVCPVLRLGQTAEALVCF